MDILQDVSILCMGRGERGLSDHLQPAACLQSVPGDSSHSTNLVALGSLLSPHQFLLREDQCHCFLTTLQWFDTSESSFLIVSGTRRPLNVPASFVLEPTGIQATQRRDAPTLLIPVTAMTTQGLAAERWSICQNSTRFFCFNRSCLYAFYTDSRNDTKVRQT